MPLIWADLRCPHLVNGWRPQTLAAARV